MVKSKNIGRPINTPDSDKSPFIHTDSKTLYFVSESTDDRWGAGDFDIFYTNKVKKEFGINPSILVILLIAKVLRRP